VQKGTFITIKNVKTLGCADPKVCACGMLKRLGITVLLADGQRIYKQITGIKEHQQVQCNCLSVSPHNCPKCCNLVECKGRGERIIQPQDMLGLQNVLQYAANTLLPCITSSFKFGPNVPFKTSNHHNKYTHSLLHY